MTLDLNAINTELQNRSPEDIVRWALQRSDRVITTTSFSPNSAAMLHLVTQIKPDMPIVWIDSGYNVPDAYRVAEQLIEQLKLNITVYTPIMSAERRNALMGGIPHPADNPELHAEFSRQVKLEPFQRALYEFKPDLWLTGIRRDETEFRKTLDIVTWDNRGLLRVAPLFHWSADDVQRYMERYQLPSCKHYFDPTKIADNVECGLHTAA
ncbi:MAG: phosphoadenylylsulfate reductase [Verrucomicrobiaceae bacterium]|nr:phosphoadenylylsulfate reductase [Verrucomicrobiaceae bacterium]